MQTLRGRLEARSHEGPCPKCGLVGKKIYAEVTANVSSSVSWEIIRHSWEINWPWLILVSVISVASPFIGLVVAGIWGVVVGLLVRAAEFVVGLYAIGRVREITRGGDR